MFNSMLGLKINTSFGGVFELNSVGTPASGNRATLVCGLSFQRNWVIIFLLTHWVSTVDMQIFPQLLTVQLKQRMRLIYGFFSVRGASHPCLFLASFQLA